MPSPSMLATVAGMWLVAVVIPGPNFLAVARMAALRGRREALITVAALGIGATTWGLAGFFGIHALFTLAPTLYAALKLAGAAYLIWLGARILRGSFGPVPDQAPAGADSAAFRLGLLTSLSNPKSALLVGSLFAAVMPPDATLATGLVTVAEMVLISLGWYAALAVMASAAPVAALFRQGRRWIDRTAGAIFVAFGLRLAVTTWMERT